LIPFKIIVNGEREIIMTLTDVIVLSGIVGAFTLFAVFLAWGEYQTRDLNRNPQQRRDGVDESSQAKSRPLHKAMKLQRIAAKASIRREVSHS